MICRLTTAIKEQNLEVGTIVHSAMIPQELFVYGKFYKARTDAGKEFLVPIDSLEVVSEETDENEIKKDQSEKLFDAIRKLELEDALKAADVIFIDKTDENSWACLDFNGEEIPLPISVAEKNLYFNIVKESIKEYKLPHIEMNIIPFHKSSQLWFVVKAKDTVKRIIHNSQNGCISGETIEVLKMEAIKTVENIVLKGD